MNSLIPVKVIDLDEIFYLVKNAPSRYLEGEEYVMVRKSLDEKHPLPKYIRRKSLIFHWK